MKKPVLAVVLLAILGGFIGQGHHAPPVTVTDQITGPVTRIVDGDTVYVNHIKLRLWGVDAPERTEPGYEAATQFVAQLTNDGDMRCDIVDKDRHDRPVALCKLPDGRDLGAAIIRAGWALDYAKHTKGHYRGDEALARRDKIGLWSYRR